MIQKYSTIIYVNDIVVNKRLYNIALYYKMDKFWSVMIFYALLSCFIMPFLGKKFMGQGGLEKGYIMGTVVSMILWFTVGKKYVM